MIICIDLETTGLEPTDEVVEIGCCDIVDKVPVEGRRYFVRPARPIPAVASGIHHITDADVKDAQPWADAWRNIAREPLADHNLVLVAHMAQFERQWIDTVLTSAWVCTWKCSLRQWPDLESHSLQTIRYALALPADPALAMPPHRAQPDAYLCALLLLELLKHQTVETLLTWSAEPPVFTKFDFGQFKGKPLSVADAGYMDWLANKEHVMGDDWRWNAKKEIARRADAVTAKAATDRKAYLEHSFAALPGAASVRDLENWFIGQADDFAKHGIMIGTDEYDALIAACKARKSVLQATGEPQFGGTAP
jgi:exodeoxyribonuclease X